MQPEPAILLPWNPLYATARRRSGTRSKHLPRRSLRERLKNAIAGGNLIRASLSGFREQTIGEMAHLVLLRTTHQNYRG